MKTVEIIGYKRANLGKSESKRLREEGNVPCVLYGDQKQVHFYSPMILFNELLFTNEAHFVHLNVEGEEYSAILQEVQFHPVSDIILHADFLALHEDRRIKMSVPVRLKGTSPGVAKGGTLIQKRRSLMIKAFPKDMPDHIDVDISELDFHHAVKVNKVVEENFEIQDTKIASIAVVEVPRALKTVEEEAAEAAAKLAIEGVEGGEVAEGEEGEKKAESKEGKEGKDNK